MYITKPKLTWTYEVLLHLWKPAGNSHIELSCTQIHYAVSASVKRQIRAALQRMVDAGRLETVPNHQSLYRLGGVIRQLSQEAGIEWPRTKPGSGLLDSRVRVWLHPPFIPSLLI